MTEILALLAVHNRADATRRCLQALRRSAGAAGVDVRVVVVNDGSDDNTRQVLEKELGPSDSILHGDGSLYWAGAMRLGMKHILAELDRTRPPLLLLNNDTYLCTDGVANLLACGAPDAIVVGHVVDAR